LTAKSADRGMDIRHRRFPRPPRYVDVANEKWRLLLPPVEHEIRHRTTAPAAPEFEFSTEPGA